MRLRRRESLLAGLALALAPATARAGGLAEELANIHARAADHGERLSLISALFLGMPYLLSPLGEGPGGDRDDDPIARFDCFDCVTLVEEVMALSWHADLDEAIARLQLIRYSDGRIDYAARKHIMMAQWIPENIAAGFVSEVTRAVGDKRVSMAHLDLTDDDFTSEEGAKLRLAEGERPLGPHSVPMVPLAQLLSLRRRIPHGTVITTIRKRRPRLPYRETHVGLVLVDGGKRVVRHAYLKSRTVVEQPIEQFVKNARAQKKWPVVGFNLLRIAAQPLDKS